MCWICKGLFTKGNYVNKSISKACNHGNRCLRAEFIVGNRRRVTVPVLWACQPTHLLRARLDITAGLQLVTWAEGMH